MLRALKRAGWTEKRAASGSHVTLEREGWPDLLWAFHGGDEIGPPLMAKIAKQTRLRPEDI